MTEQTIVCITCPRGCTMKVKQDGDEITVTGNSCKRGEQFAVNELTHPMRTICSTVATAFRETPVLPCRVSTDIPKDKIFDVMKEITKCASKNASAAETSSSKTFSAPAQTSSRRRTF